MHVMKPQTNNNDRKRTARRHISSHKQRTSYNNLPLHHSVGWVGSLLEESSRKTGISGGLLTIEALHDIVDTGYPERCMHAAITPIEEPVSPLDAAEACVLAYSGLVDHVV